MIIYFLSEVFEKNVVLYNSRPLKKKKSPPLNSRKIIDNEFAKTLTDEKCK